MSGNDRPVRDVVIGHAAPSTSDPKVRAELLDRLKKAAPSFSYEFTEAAFRPTTITIYSIGSSDEHDQEEWSWTLPLRAGGRWILTVDEFLAYELARMS
jgi:hypothetical protein